MNLLCQILLNSCCNFTQFLLQNYTFKFKLPNNFHPFLIASQEKSFKNLKKHKAINNSLILDKTRRIFFFIENNSMFITCELMFTAYELMFITYELMFTTHEHKLHRQEKVFLYTPFQMFQIYFFVYSRRKVSMS